METKNFKESTWVIDLKIVILAACCLLGYLSHFVLKFPKESKEVGMCLAGYCVLTAIHYLLENYIEKGAFYVSKSHEFSRFRDWQKLRFTSDVVVADDGKSADY